MATPRTRTTKTNAAPARPGELRVLPLVALRETVIFPEMIVPLQVGREKSVKALDAAVAADSLIALVTQRQAEREDIAATDELYAVGTLAKIAQVVQAQDGTVRAIVQGQQRLRLVSFEGNDPYISAQGRGPDRREARGRRGPGARAHRPGPDRAVRPVGRAGPARGRGRGPQHHRAGPAGRHGRLQPGHDDRAAPGAARDARRHRAAQARVGVPRPPGRDPRAQGPHPVGGQVRARQDASASTSSASS